jgi:hypothetical protein
MNVISLCATVGRHTLLERSLKFFIDQDFEGEHTLLIYNNSRVSQQIAPLDLPSNKRLILVNQHIDSQTKQPYSSLGAIYNDILTYIPDECSLINFQDDDDIFLPNHILEGVKGYIRGQKKAYKPFYSYYRSTEGVTRVANTMEPSIFVQAEHIRKHGFSLVTTEQHLQWLNPLIASKEIFVDENGPSTLIYDWGDNQVLTYKTSGDFHNPLNFSNCRHNSKDHGDRVITPWEDDRVKQYYNLVKNQ